MKKHRKYTILIIIILLLLLAGCGNSESSSSRTTANTGGGPSGAADSNHADTKDASKEIDGQIVTYGPITVTLPEEYMAKEKYPNQPIYYAMDRDSEEAEYRPDIRFLTDYKTITSNADVNKENLIANIKEIFSIMEDSEFKEVVSYEETELDGYKVIKAKMKEVVYEKPLIEESYYICEKIGSEGTVVRIDYKGLESDTEHLSDFEACLESVSLRTEMSENESEWQRIFYFKSGAAGNPLNIAKNYVFYDPLTIELPDGYAVEDDAAESLVFSRSDGSSFCLKFTEGSYRLMSDQAYAENLFKEELESKGITDVRVIHHEVIRISGYDGCEIGIQASKNGQSLIEFMYVIFEKAEGDMTPTFIVTYAASEEVAQGMTNEVDTAFNSIQMQSE